MKEIPEHVKNDPVLSYFWKRIYYYDQNVLLIICGGTGTCKSGCALTLGSLLDVNYKGENRFGVDRVVFKAEDFVQLVNTSSPKGSVIVWDEIGVEHDSRNYYTLKNKLVKYVMQTFRYKNFILIMTVPDLKSIDIGTRRLLHCYLEMQGPIGNRKMARGMLKLVQINPQTGKDYYKHMRFFDKNKKTLSAYYIKRPPAELEEAYKEKKKVMTEEWYTNFNEQLAYMENVVGAKQSAAKAASTTIKEMADLILEDPSLAFNHHSGKFVGTLIQPWFEERGKKFGFQKCCAVSQYLNNLVKEGKVELGFSTEPEKRKSRYKPVVKKPQKPRVVWQA